MGPDLELGPSEVCMGQWGPFSLNTALFKVSCWES